MWPSLAGRCRTSHKRVSALIRHGESGVPQIDDDVVENVIGSTAIGNGSGLFANSGRVHAQLSGVRLRRTGEYAPARDKGRPGPLPVAERRGQKISGMKVWSDIGGRT